MQLLGSFSYHCDPLCTFLTLLNPDSQMCRHCHACADPSLTDRPTTAGKDRGMFCSVISI